MAIIKRGKSHVTTNMPDIHIGSVRLAPYHATPSWLINHVIRLIEAVYGYGLRARAVLTSAFVTVPAGWRMHTGNHECPYSAILVVHSAESASRQRPSWRHVTSLVSIHEGDPASALAALWKARPFADAMVSYDQFRGTRLPAHPIWNSPCSVVHPHSPKVPELAFHPCTITSDCLCAYVVARCAVVLSIDRTPSAITRMQSKLVMRHTSSSEMDTTDVWNDTTLLQWDTTSRTTCALWPPAVIWYDSLRASHNDSKLLLALPINGTRRMLLPSTSHRGVRINKLQYHHTRSVSQDTRRGAIPNTFTSPYWLPSYCNRLTVAVVASFTLDSSKLLPEPSYAEELGMLRRGLQLVHVTRHHAAARIQRAWRTAIADPEFMICRRRILREFHEPHGF